MYAQIPSVNSVFAKSKILPPLTVLLVARNQNEKDITLFVTRDAGNVGSCTYL